MKNVATKFFNELLNVSWFSILNLFELGAT